MGANVIQVTEERNNSHTPSTPIVKLISVAGIDKVIDDPVSGSKALIFNARANGKGASSIQGERLVTQSRGTVQTAMDVSHTNSTFAVTVKGKEGDSPSLPTTGTKVIGVGTVVEAFAAPDVTDSILVLQESGKTNRTIYTVDETVAALLALINV